MVWYGLVSKQTMEYFGAIVTKIIPYYHLSYPHFPGAIIVPFILIVSFESYKYFKVIVKITDLEKDITAI